MAMPNLLDIAIANEGDDVVGLIDEVANAHPEIMFVPARTIRGTNYKTLVRTVLPGVGFRDANEGYAATKGTYENRLIETFIFNPRWECDKAVADSSEDGPEAFIAMEAQAIMESAMQALSEQFYYGRGTSTVCGLGTTTVKGDAKGFYGLLELSEALGLAVATNPLLVDAGSASATKGSSVYMIRRGMQDVKWVWGQEGNLAVDPPTQERILDGSSNPFTAYVQEMLAYPGLQVGSIYSFGRIGELGITAGTDTLTDAHLAEVYSKFPGGKKPDLILMTRRSQWQLQSSRLIATGMTILPDGQPVPFPTSWENIPIAVTDAISDAEEIGLLS